MWIVFLSGGGSIVAVMVKWFVSFFFSSKSKLCDNFYTCSFSLFRTDSLFVLILILFLFFYLSIVNTFRSILIFLRSIFFVFVYWHELREYGTTTPLLLEFDEFIGRNSFSLFPFFFFFSRAKFRWMSMQNVRSLRYFSSVSSNGGIDGSRRSSKCRVAKILFLQ